MENQVKGVNVAPTSNAGHFCEAEKVVLLDEINETFKVEGKSVLVTEKHTSLKTDESGLITCQQVFDPMAGRFVKTKD